MKIWVKRLFGVIFILALFLGLFMAVGESLLNWLMALF
jgi:hypothetical protein